MADKQIIPFGTDLNKLPPIEEPLAIVPIGEPLPLAIVPPKKLAPIPPKRSYGQSYFAQIRQPTFTPPQERLFLKDKSHQLKGLMIQVQKNIKLFPPKPNEMLTSVNTNKFGEVSCAKYTTATPRVVFDGVRAAPGQIRIIPPKETMKRPTLAPLEREEKR